MVDSTFAVVVDGSCILIVFVVAVDVVVATVVVALSLTTMLFYVDVVVFVSLIASLLLGGLLGSGHISNTRS